MTRGHRTIPIAMGDLPIHAYKHKPYLRVWLAGACPDVIRRRRSILKSSDLHKSSAAGNASRLAAPHASSASFHAVTVLHPLLALTH